MQEYKQYISVQEAAERLSRPEPEIWRMLETGVLPAVLRAELAASDGTPIKFDFALLPPEGVARVADQGGDDFTLEWNYCGEYGKAICQRARRSSIHVLWEPSLFTKLMPQPENGAQVCTGVNTQPQLQTDSERRLIRLRTMGGNITHKHGGWKINGISTLVQVEKSEGRKRSDEKTIRLDLKEAAENEREAKRANAFHGLGKK